MPISMSYHTPNIANKVQYYEPDPSSSMEDLMCRSHEHVKPVLAYLYIYSSLATHIRVGGECICPLSICGYKISSADALESNISIHTLFSYPIYLYALICRSLLQHLTTLADSPNTTPPIRSVTI